MTKPYDTPQALVEWILNPLIKHHVPSVVEFVEARDAAIRADQARKDAGIARQSGRQQFLAAGIVGRDSPCVVSYGVIAAEIERHAGIGEEQKP